MEVVHVQEMSPKPLVSARDSPVIGGKRRGAGLWAGRKNQMEEGTPEGLLGLSGVFSFPSDKILAQFWFGSVAEQAGCSEWGSVGEGNASHERVKL